MPDDASAEPWLEKLREVLRRAGPVTTDKPEPEVRTLEVDGRTVLLVDSSMHESILRVLRERPLDLIDIAPPGDLKIPPIAIAEPRAETYAEVEADLLDLVTGRRSAGPRSRPAKERDPAKEAKAEAKRAKRRAQRIRR